MDPLVQRLAMQEQRSLPDCPIFSVLVHGKSSDAHMEAVDMVHAYLEKSHLSRWNNDEFPRYPENKEDEDESEGAQPPR